MLQSLKILFIGAIYVIFVIPYTWISEKCLAYKYRNPNKENPNE